METQDMGLQSCSVCGRRFAPRFSFQTMRSDHGVTHFCSQSCLLKSQRKQADISCSTCGKPFTPKYAYQRVVVSGETRYYCSEDCASEMRVEVRKDLGKRRIAVLNQKGGTGKTTTAINLAAGLASRGYRVLLIDMDAQGNVGISLGIVGEFGTYHLLIDGRSVDECAVPIRDNLDIITSNETLAAAEIKLATAQGRELALKQMLIGNQGEKEYDVIILDCPPSLSLVNQNALVYADEVIVPVSCDFLAMVGVKQILRTIKNINSFMGHSISISGILPTFFDVRTRLSQEVLRNLEDYFKDKVLPPIRISTRLKEAPSHKKTIFEYAPGSHAADDYLAVVDRLMT